MNRSLIYRYLLGLTLCCGTPLSAYAANATDTRTVVCRDNSGNVVADSFCTGTKPDTTRVGAVCEGPGGTPSDPPALCAVGPRLSGFVGAQSSYAETNSQQLTIITNSVLGRFLSATTKVRYNGVVTTITSLCTTTEAHCTNTETANIGGRSFNVRVVQSYTGKRMDATTDNDLPLCQ